MVDQWPHPPAGSMCAHDVPRQCAHTATETRRILGFLIPLCADHGRVVDAWAEKINGWVRLAKERTS